MSAIGIDMSAINILIISIPLAFAYMIFVCISYHGSKHFENLSRYRLSSPFDVRASHKLAYEIYNIDSKKWPVVYRLSVCMARILLPLLALSVVALFLL